MKLNDLHIALRHLRATWPQTWLGLPQVLAGCLQQLGHAHTDAHGQGDALSAPSASLVACMQALAEDIEADGRARQAQGLEPAYHNRLHMADALVALTALLLETRQGTPPFAHAECLAMLAMLGHDFLHDGTVNKTPSELEWRSVRQLQPLMATHGVSPADADIVKDLILSTDPTGVPASHQKIAGRVFTVEDPDCLAVLVQEADILASSLPGVGEELTRQLAQEWALFDAPRAEQVLTAKGRLGFLRFGALFSSPASQRLGLGELRAAQITHLEASLLADSASASSSAPA